MNKKVLVESCFFGLRNLLKTGPALSQWLDQMSSGGPFQPELSGGTQEMTDYYMSTKKFVLNFHRQAETNGMRFKLLKPFYIINLGLDVVFWFCF